MNRMTKEIPLSLALELTRLQVQRDELADLARVLMSWAREDAPLDDLSARLAEILDDQRKRKVG